MKRVNYCLNGVGYFGGRSLRSAIQLQPNMLGRHSPVDLKIFAISDPSPAARRGAEETLRLLQISLSGVSFVSNITDVLEKIRVYDEGLSRREYYVIHDCSPTHLHYSNISDAFRNFPVSDDLRARIAYLVEKPAMTAKDYRFDTLLAQRRGSSLLQEVESGKSNFFCDFIELKSLTYISAAAWMRENNFEPCDIKVWRNSGTGFKKVFSEGRHGVTGGALEDKAAHDLALIFGYCGMPDDRPTVSAAEFPRFLPGRRTELEGARPSYRTMDDGFVQLLDRRFESDDPSEQRKLIFDVADSRVTADVSFTSQGKARRCKLSFSWDNVDDSLQADLGALGLPESVLWQDSQIGQTHDGAKTYRVREARIHLITAPNGDRVCLNFLTKFHGQESAWAFYIPREGAPESIPIRTLPGGDNSLFRILMCVADAISGGELAKDEEILTAKKVAVVTGVVHDIRKLAVEKEAPSPSAWQEHVDSFITSAELEDVFAVKAVVFDLDNTLIATTEILDRVVDPVVDAIISVGERSDYPASWTQEMRSMLMRFALDKVANALSFSSREYEAACIAFEKLSVDNTMLTREHIFSDVVPLLRKLNDLSVPVYLLTRGFERLQRSKIDVLDDLVGFKSFFKGLLVHDLTRDGTGATQFGHLSEVLNSLRSKQGIRPFEILVVGDDPRSELAVASQLGLRTMMISRRDVFREDVSHEHITSLSSVASLWGVE